MNNYGTGCIKSKLDGTEHIFEAKVSLPFRFSLRSIMPPVTDQGETSKCVAHSLCSYMDYKKNSREGDKNGGQFNIDTLYLMRDNKNEDGMQIKNGLHILRHVGLNGFKINKYAKVNSLIPLKAALLLNGPCPIALPVKSWDSHFWRGKTIKGYHCLLAVGFHEKNGIELRNSWGKNWADNGYTFIGYDELENTLIEAWTII